MDFGLFAWNEAGYRLLEREVTAATVQAHFAPWLPGQVDAWPLPNILAMKFVLHGALREWFEARRLRAHVTLSDETDYATSQVIVEQTAA